MAYKALYREWRPMVFEDVVEQEHVVKTLKYSVSSNRVAHAYLFCGTRGTGKTSMAHILSRAINCINPNDGNPCNECEICKGIISGSLLDVIEIDAASNNSVDNVREIRDEVIYAPSQAKYKVYIIDEVHMLSSGAFNALLKTLEEPPSHVVFILATTEPHKLPATILSRCQRFDFRRITIDSIAARLSSIAEANNVSISNDALRLISRKSDGALRDAISLFDQCMSSGSENISYNDVLSIIGIVNEGFMSELVEAINDRNIGSILEHVDKLIMDGKDITQFTSDLILYYRNLLVIKLTKDPTDLVDASKEAMDIMQKQCHVLTQNEIIYIIKELSQLETSFKWTPHPRVLLEVSLIKICESRTNSDETVPLSSKRSEIYSGISEGIKAEYNSVPKKKVAESNPSSVANSGATLSEESGVSLECWDSVLKELKSSGRMVLFTNLIGTKAFEVNNRIVGISFGEGKSFNKLVCLKPENAEIVEGVLSKKLGREIKIKCVEDDFTKENINTSTISEESEKYKSKSEVIEKVRDIANKSNIPFSIIDE